MPKIQTSKSKARHARLKPGQDSDAKVTRSASQIVALYFGFHRYCGNAHCRRANACKGDTCFRAYWPHVPEREKERFRKTMLARANGLSIADAMAAGEAAAVRCDEFQAKGREWSQQMPPARHPSDESRVEPPSHVEPAPAKPSWRPRIRVL